MYAFCAQVTSRIESKAGSWNEWNWKSKGDFFDNGAFFGPSGSEARPGARLQVHGRLSRQGAHSNIQGRAPHHPGCSHKVGGAYFVPSGSKPALVPAYKCTAVAAAKVPTATARAGPLTFLATPTEKIGRALGSYLRRLATILHSTLLYSTVHCSAEKQTSAPQEEELFVGPGLNRWLPTDVLFRLGIQHGRVLLYVQYSTEQFVHLLSQTHLNNAPMHQGYCIFQ